MVRFEATSKLTVRKYRKTGLGLGLGEKIRGEGERLGKIIKNYRTGKETGRKGRKKGLKGKGRKREKERKGKGGEAREKKDYYCPVRGFSMRSRCLQGQRIMLEGYTTARFEALVKLTVGKKPEKAENKQLSWYYSPV